MFEAEHCGTDVGPTNSFGAVAPILVLYLRALGFSDEIVGGFFSLTLLGDVCLSLVVTSVKNVTVCAAT